MNRLSTIALGAAFLSSCVVHTTAPPQGGTYGGQPGQPGYTGGPGPTPAPTPAPSPDYTPPAEYVGTGGGSKGAINPSYPRVMIVIPEFHITRDKVPDPAAEIEFMKAFKTAGYKLIDKKQSEKVWKDDVLFKL